MEKVNFFNQPLVLYYDEGIQPRDMNGPGTCVGYAYIGKPTMFGRHEIYIFGVTETWKK
jgi:hypothetical protein